MVSHNAPSWRLRNDSPAKLAPSQNERFILIRDARAYQRLAFGKAALVVFVSHA